MSKAVKTRKYKKNIFDKLRSEVGTLKKWHFVFGLSRDWSSTYGYEFNLGIFKMTSYPEEGCQIGPINYKGFWIRKRLYFGGFEISI